MATYVVNPNDPTSPTNTQGAKQGAEELRALKLKIQQIVAGALISTAAGANAADITTFIQPDPNDRPSIVAGGWLPWNLNQQWGGAGCTPFHMVDSATGIEYKFDAFDAYIDNNDNTTASVAQAAANIYRFQVITPSKSLSLQALWLKFYKVNNPVDNVTVSLYTVVAGVPGALIATANVINGKQITSDANGQWYRFSFAVVQALVAGTQYMIVITKSGGLDAVNFYNLLTKTTTRYPSNLQGVGTVVPAWTATNTITANFICEAQASDQAIQTAGTFTGRIVGSGTGNPTNRAVGYCKPLREFFPLFHPNGWSILLRGKSWTKDATIAEFMYGLHHDRINVRCNTATGFTCVTIFKSDGSGGSITGTSDISGNAYKDILIVGRSMGDGGDYCKIYVGIGGVWTKEVESTAQTYTFDPLMLKQGTGWIMGGFQVFFSGNYTKISDMGVLPSADGWTFATTTATAEGNVFAISGGKLSQIKAGMAAGGDGLYRKAAAALVNATGWHFATKVRCISNTNTATSAGAAMQVRIQDGTKDLQTEIQEYFIGTNFAVSGMLPQLDCKYSDIVYNVSGKGSDYFAVVNGKYLVDGTGALTSASATNQIDWGDGSTTANENADAEYDYVGYYSGANLILQFTAGELHEFAVFSGDKNLLGQALYNAGVPLSVKQYCGLSRAYVGESVAQKLYIRGVIGGNTTASTTPVLNTDMEAFVLGSEFSISHQTVTINSGANNVNFIIQTIDGVTMHTNNESSMGQPTATLEYTLLFGPKTIKTNFGLHKIEGRWGVSAGTATVIGTRKTMNLETRA